MEDLIKGSRGWRRHWTRRQQKLHVFVAGCSTTCKKKKGVFQVLENSLCNKGIKVALTVGKDFVS